MTSKNTTIGLKKNYITIDHDATAWLPQRPKVLRDALLDQIESHNSKFLQQDLAAQDIELDRMVKLVYRALHSPRMCDEMAWQYAYEEQILRNIYKSHAFCSQENPFGEIEIQRNHNWAAAHAIRQLPERDELKRPKPDIYLAIHVDQTEKNPIWKKFESFYEPHGHRNLSLDRLVELGKRGIVCNPLRLIGIKQSTGNPTQEIGAHEAKHFTCFPWAVMEIKHAHVLSSVAEMCVNQVANATATALDMLNQLTVGAGSQDFSHIPPVVGFTFIGKSAALWIAYLHNTDTIWPGKRIQRIWDGVLDSEAVIRKFVQILKNMLHWGSRHFRPWLSDLLSRKYEALRDLEKEQSPAKCPSCAPETRNPPGKIVPTIEGDDGRPSNIGRVFDSGEISGESSTDSEEYDDEYLEESSDSNDRCENAAKAKRQRSRSGSAVQARKQAANHASTTECDDSEVSAVLHNQQRWPSEETATLDKAVPLPHRPRVAITDTSKTSKNPSSEVRASPQSAQRSKRQTSTVKSSSHDKSKTPPRKARSMSVSPMRTPHKYNTRSSEPPSTLQHSESINFQAPEPLSPSPCSKPSEGLTLGITEDSGSGIEAQPGPLDSGFGGSCQPSAGFLHPDPKSNTGIAPPSDTESQQETKESTEPCPQVNLNGRITRRKSITPKSRQVLDRADSLSIPDLPPRPSSAAA